MKILNIGQNNIANKFNLFNNKDNINIDTIESTDDLPMNYSYDFIVLNIPSCLGLDGSQDIENIKLSVQTLNTKYNNPIIINTTPLLPGTNSILGTNIVYWKNPEKVDNTWYIATNNCLIREKLEGFISLLNNNNSNISNNIESLDYKQLEILLLYEILVKSAKNTVFNELKDYCQHVDINIETIEKHIDHDNNSNSCIENNIHNLISFSYKLDEEKSSNYITDSLIYRFIKKDHTTLDWLPKNDLIDEVNELESLKKLTLTQLNNFCQENNIDISDCIEKIDVIDMIIDFKKSKTYKIKHLQPQYNNNQPYVDQMPISSSNHIPQNSHVQRQSGIPLQLNPPPSVNLNRPFNMNVRNNNGNGFLNLRPGTSNGRGGGGGGIRFGGGVQSVRGR